MIKNLRKINKELLAKNQRLCSNPNCLSTNPQPLSNFYTKKRGGYEGRCINCVKSKNNKYYHNNAEDIKARQASYPVTEEKKQYYGQWQKQNRDKIKAYWKKYASKNPEAIKISSANRRARIKNAEGSITTQEWRDLIKQIPYCVSCGKSFNEKTKPTIDHIKPLSCGGSHNKENIQPMCMYCNQSKGAKELILRPDKLLPKP